MAERAGEKVTEKIRIWGIVQGVGFRPFVAKTAERFNMKGEVLNIGGLVEIVLTDTEERISVFLEELRSKKPGPAEIVHISRDRIDKREFDRFMILNSDDGDREAAMIPADLSICPHCLEEMLDPKDPRYMHPFISCMECGPRYTIIDRFPYDRENTSMVDFPMCGFCREQYENIDDRRYHAQTISCHDCGPQMNIELEKAAELLKEGKVIAFKSVGGYNLVADPFNGGAVRDLRQIKKREQKPFAVMFKTLDEVKKYCRVNSVEGELLASSAKPIILLEKKPEEEMTIGSGADFTEIRKSRFIGSYLPSMGAQYILLALFGGPLIFTSANLSNMPMIREDEEMQAMMEREDLISEMFYNERKIRVSADDSVVRVIDGQPQMIRRSKGYAPVPLYMEGAKGEILAAGGQLKNSFSLSKGPFAYVSQYFGDMDTEENRYIYETNVDRMADLFRVEPDRVVCDMHPGYYTTGFAEKYADDRGLTLIKVQHHHAHVASVMAEHGITGPVIGVSFDGTGYGTDGAIWGGEFLYCRGAGFQRKAHLKYVDMIGGDSSMKDGRKTALCYIHDRKDGRPAVGRDEIYPDIDGIIEYAEENGTLDGRDRTIIMKAVDARVNTIRSSSMGRLFDAVSAMLGICGYNSYEGQCAIMLEDKAAAYMNRTDTGKDAELAYRFHIHIADMILEQCEKIRSETGCYEAALTGGVFQNKLLMEETLKRLREKGFRPYYNISVSPNDGGIALGQTYLAALKEEN
ncbi:MAG: carbamoyltransferase HypF [Eubacteriaceae bacterium]|nr:carbamoyltransferase HypF [Eubacteriaceae bacterium]